MGDKEKNSLYQDAIYWHLIGLGYTEFQAELEAKRRIEKMERLGRI